ncbi:MAG: DUF1838 family protein [Rhodospirillaceae bacterium]|nr:DUF1838 family protein [Rhodospirillaceae bacterium]
MIDQLNRRALVSGAGAMVGFSLFGSDALATTRINLSDEQEALRAYAKLVGSTERATVHYWYAGTIYGVLPGEGSLPILGFAGLAKNLWRPMDDGSFSQRIFDVGYFADLETGEPVDELLNPITGKVNHPVHYLSGPSQFTRSAEPRNWKISGDDIWLEESLSFKMPNWLSPEEWPLASSGNTLHFRYTNTYHSKLYDITDPYVSSAPSLFGWNAITDWYPFMLMGQRPGFLNWIGQGKKVQRPSDILPQTMNYLKTYYPNYLDSDEPWEKPANNYVQYMEQRQPMKPGRR